MDHVKSVSQQVKQASVKAFQDLSLPVEYLRNPLTDKDAMVRQVAAKRKLTEALGCALTTVDTDLKRRNEGERVKYRMNGNSAKFYDKAYSEIGSVLSGAETTINNVEDSVQGGRSRGRPPVAADAPGIGDLHRRAEVSQKANDRCRMRWRGPTTAGVWRS